MALLGVDLGERRIGLAVAEGEPPRAVPLTTLPRRASVAADVADLARIVTERGIVELVIGLPFEASGIEGPQARSTRAWADEVGRLLALPLAYRDERLTSHLAEGRVGAAKRGRSGGPPTPAQRRAPRLHFQVIGFRGRLGGLLGISRVHPPDVPEFDSADLRDFGRGFVTTAR